MNERIAYFLGVLNSDGYSETRRLRDGRIRHRLRFHVGEKSLEMLKMLKRIFQEEFKRSIKIHSGGVNEYNTKFYIELSFKRLLPLFEKLEIKKGVIPS